MTLRLPKSMPFCVPAEVNNYQSQFYIDIIVYNILHFTKKDRFVRSFLVAEIIDFKGNFRV